MLVIALQQYGASLLTACAEGDSARAKRLLALGAGVNSTDSAGNSALHIAAQRGAYELVELLMRHGANIAATNWSGQTALYLAAEHGHPGVVEKLLRAGASADGIIDALSGAGPDEEQASSDSSRAEEIPLHDGIIADLLRYRAYLLVPGAAMPMLTVSTDGLMKWLADFDSGGAPGPRAEIDSKGLARYLFAEIRRASENREACWKALAYTEFNSATPAQKHACCAVMLGSLDGLALGRSVKDTLLSSRLSPDAVQRYSRLLKRQMLWLMSAARRSERVLLQKMADLRQMHAHAFSDPDAYYSPISLQVHLQSAGIAGLLAERMVAAYTGIFKTYDDTLRPDGLSAFAGKLHALLGADKFARALDVAFARHDQDPMVVRLLNRQIDLLKLACLQMAQPAPGGPMN
ncbi:MAG: ankyrin repeat domain-containing protein [Noviherbaspirillum sp.]